MAVPVLLQFTAACKQSGSPAKAPAAVLWARKALSCLYKSSDFPEQWESSIGVTMLKGQLEGMPGPFMWGRHTKVRQHLFGLQEKPPHFCSAKRKDVLPGHRLFNVEPCQYLLLDEEWEIRQNHVHFCLWLLCSSGSISQPLKGFLSQMSSL